MRAAIGQAVCLRVGAWYGDTEVRLDLPAAWRVEVRGPDTPPPLTDDQLRLALEHPVGQPPIRVLAASRRRPCLVVDDLSRPTPAARLVPMILGQLRDAGVAAEEVTIVLAKGSHGPVHEGTWDKKVGREAAARCRLIVHEYDRDLVRRGRTAHGTPILVNRHVAAADLLIGVGGIYPQHTTGFGGGSKLALGVLGRRSIVALHYGHDSMLGSGDPENAFRRDLDEIATGLGLRTMVSVHVDARREIVRAVAGDPLAYYADAVAFSRRAYSVAPPDGADIVICNTYPQDVSLTFMRSKGLAPLSAAAAAATRIAIGAPAEGVGLHRLFPFVEDRWEPSRQRARKLMMRGPRVILRRLARSRPGSRAPQSPSPVPAAAARRPILLFSPIPLPASLLAGSELWRGSGDRVVPFGQWNDVVAAAVEEQRSVDRPRAVVYPCASIQVLERRKPT